MERVVNAMALTSIITSERCRKLEHTTELQSSRNKNNGKHESIMFISRYEVVETCKDVVRDSATLERRSMR